MREASQALASILVPLSLSVPTFASLQSATRPTVFLFTLLAGGSYQVIIERKNFRTFLYELTSRCLAWHPHTHKLAVGYNDDTVKVVTTSAGAATQPLLKFAGMKGLTCLAWQPFAASQLAVGCSSGVLLWTVDPASVVSRPSSSCVVRCVDVEYLTRLLTSSPGWRDFKAQQPQFVGLLMESWWPPAHPLTQGSTYGVQPHRC